MGFIHEQRGRIAIETRRESFIIHPDRLEWATEPHPEFLLEDLPDLVSALQAAVPASPTDEDVERAAMAIAHEASPYRWTQLNNADKGWFRDMARAALSAYLEGPEWKWTEEELDEMQDLTEAE